MKHTKSAIFWLLTYPLGIILWLFLWLLDVFGLIEIIGQENIAQRRGIILASNHPSLWEPILLYYLYMPRLFFRPSVIPLSAADRRNYGRNWLWLPFWPLFVSIDRHSGKHFGCFRVMTDHLNMKGNLIIFPEGGRTSSGSQMEVMRYYNGKHLKPLQSGACALAYKTGSLIAPIWVEGSDKVLPRKAILPRFWHKVTIVISEPYAVSADEKAESLHLAHKILECSNKLKLKED